MSRFSCLFRLLTAASLLLATAPSLLAWSANGHMVIAAAAWRELSPAVQRHVSEILKAHPDYRDWQRDFARDSQGLDLALYLVLRASAWPDEIRRQGGAYDHPRWHYINHPLRAPRFRRESASPGDDDILQGIAESEKALTDRRSAPAARAAALAWLIHLTGDLHQPLHCASLFSPEFPEGDEGGNRFWIKPADRAIPLHSFWDGLLGTRHDPRAAVNEAIRISSEHPRRSLAELKRETTPEQWSVASRTLALDEAYRHSKLKPGTTPENARPLPPDYPAKAKIAAERQAALAGHRLADELAHCLK